MKSADSLHHDILNRLDDINQIIEKGISVFNEHKNNPDYSFYYRSGFYTVISLKSELDSYKAEKQLLENLCDFYGQFIN